MMKRMPHGTTLLLVEGAAALLAREAAEGAPITRAALHEKLATTGLSAHAIDDRIRALVRFGRLTRVGQGAYAMPSVDIAATGGAV